MITEWIGSGMGAPDKFLIGNRGEFDNESYYEFAEQLNIEICATGAHFSYHVPMESVSITTT